MTRLKNAKTQRLKHSICLWALACAHRKNRAILGIRRIAIDGMQVQGRQKVITNPCQIEIAHLK